MTLLYYWRGDNYRRDLDFGAGYNLNQSNALLHEIERGESLWAFTRRKDGAYVLAAELVARGKTLNPMGFLIRNEAPPSSLGELPAPYPVDFSARSQHRVQQPHPVPARHVAA